CALCRMSLPYAAPIRALPEHEHTLGSEAGAATREGQAARHASPPRTAARSPRSPSPGADGRGRWPSSPALGGRELLCVVAAGVALAVITSWPLVLHLPSRIAPDLGDPVRTAWQVAWVGHGILHDPLHLFDANAFYPHPLSLAFSDSLLGYGPTAF